MKQQPLDGVAAAESLYGSGKQETTSKVANPDNKYNVFGCPSIIPGVKYPVTDREQQIINATWYHAIKLALHQLVIKDTLLDHMRDEVGRIRKEDLGYE